MPPLHRIRDDIPLLVDHFLERVALEKDKAKNTVTPGVLDHLMGRQWPGNTRQLENRIRGGYAVIPDDRISTAHLAVESLPALCPTELIDRDKPYQELKEQAIEAFTLKFLNRLIGKTGGNVSAAAQLSGMKRQSMQ